MRKAVLMICLKGLWSFAALFFALAATSGSSVKVVLMSIFSVQSARQLSEETETPIDKRRFRANVYLDLASDNGFAENELVGQSLKIGRKVIVRVLERDARCAMIALDPDTAERTPAVLKKVAQAHEGTAGVYAAVIVEGMLHKGDSVELLS